MRKRWIGSTLTLVLMMACIGVAWLWPAMTRVARGIDIEISCWRADSRTECRLRGHQAAEAMALMAIEEELRALNPTNPCGPLRPAAEPPDCPGRNRISSDEP